MICHQPINRGISSFDIFYLKIYIYIYIHAQENLWTISNECARRSQRNERQRLP